MEILNVRLVILQILHVKENGQMVELDCIVLVINTKEWNKHKNV